VNPVNKLVERPQHLVGISEDALPPQLPNRCDDFVGPGPIHRKVPSVNHLIRCYDPQIEEHTFQRVHASMNVGDDG